MKIVLLEQQSEQRQACESSLRGWGYSVFVAESLAQAFDCLEKERPSIFIVDWTCIGGNPQGESALHQQKETASLPYLIWATFPAETPVLLENLNPIVDDVLFKPFNLVELRAKIRAGRRILDLELQLEKRMEKLEESNKIISRTNQQMKRDIFAVAKIQASLLPSALPSVPEAEFAWVYKPKDELAGDCLNVFRLDEHHLAFYVLDVAGRGTASALLSVSLSRRLTPFPSQSKLLKQLTDTPPGYRIMLPNEVLCNLNETFPLDVDTQQFFTIFYGILHLPSLRLTYAMAGHPRPYRVGAKTIEMLEGGGPPIGFLDEVEFEQYVVQLEAGDRLLVYTDGISEAMNGAGEFFGKEALSAFIQKTSPLGLQESLNLVLKEAEQWTGKAGLHDDVSILGFELKEVVTRK
jgi:sigma-B regulation protein RsbU (phosphoserine phosphatase)